MTDSPGQAAPEPSGGREAASWPDPWWFALLLGLFVLVAFPQIIFGLQTFVYRDFGYFGYPLAHYFRESIARGELPLWNPLNECGLPFLAQWNAQVFYPPAWLYLVLPLSWALGVFCLAHLFLGGLGMFVLANRWTRKPFAAAVAGIAFAFNGLMLNSLIWPNNIAALGLMPWVVLLVENAWRHGSRHVITAALVGTMQMLAGAPEVILLTWIVIGSLALVEAFRRGAAMGRVLTRTGLVVLLISGLSAVQLLPFLDLLKHSHRDASFATDAWAMPPTGWANFLVPLLHAHPGSHGVFVQEGQYWTASYYLGVAVVALALLAIWRNRDRRVWMLAGLSALFLVLALGDAGVLYAWLRQHIGVVSFMRFPIKLVVLPVFALPLLAAYAIATQEKSGEWSRKWVGAVWLVVMLLMLAIVWHAAKFPLPDDDWNAIWRNALGRAGFFTAILVVLFFVRKLTDAKMRRWLQIALLALVWFDLLTHAPMHKTVASGLFAPNMAREMPPPKYGEARAMLSSLAYNKMQFTFRDDPAADYIGRRVALFSNCNLLDSVPVLHGFYSLHLPEHLDVGALLYAATNSAAPRLVEFLGVSQVTSPTNILEWESTHDFLPLITGGQRPAFANASITLQRLASEDWDPRREVFLPPEERAFVRATNEARVKISDPHTSAQRITLNVEADAPALVVVAQSYYHDWKVYVDGQPSRLLRANHAFQAFAVPAGRHSAALVYEDRALSTGAAISLFTLGICGIGWFRWRRE